MLYKITLRIDWYKKVSVYVIEYTMRPFYAESLEMTCIKYRIGFWSLVYLFWGLQIILPYVDWTTHAYILRSSVLFVMNTGFFKTKLFLFILISLGTRRHLINRINVLSLGWPLLKIYLDKKWNHFKDSNSLPLMICCLGVEVYSTAPLRLAL